MDEIVTDPEVEEPVIPDESGDENDPQNAAMERTLRTREFPVTLEQGDGRTIDARIVPYNTPAQVADPPFFQPYMEEFLPGAFDKQTRAADKVKVWLNFEHEAGLRGIVGHGISLVDEGNSFLRSSFRVHDNADGDKALQMVRDGLLTGMSVEYVPLKSRRSETGVVQRLRAHLDKVSLCRFPAYSGAEIMAVRTKPVFAEIEVPHADPELTERLAALGVEPLSRKAVTWQTWDPDPGRYSDEEYEAACLVNRGGDAPAKERCALLVMEPDGTINARALEPAVAVLARGALHKLSRQDRTEAASKLIRYYRLAGIDSPDALTRMAHGKAVSPHRPVGTTTKPREFAVERLNVGDFPPAPERVNVSIKLDGKKIAESVQSMSRIDSMIRTANTFIENEPDAEKKASMESVIGILQGLRGEDETPAE